MTEILAVLTVAFAVYVLYEVFKTVSQPNDSQTHIQPSPPAQAPAAEKPKAAAPKPAAPAPVAKAATPPAPAAAEEEKAIILRDPSSGETTPVPTNYRFAKKWIKEALVTEGLLKKVYKNSELTGAANNTVKEALEKFKHIEKYQA